ncbi:MAG: hypothetical protein ACNA7K_02860 [Acholeplasmataceae bacterium]
MKKFVLGFILLSVALLSACTDGYQVNTNMFETNEDVISFQALTAFSLLSSSDANQPLSQHDTNVLLSYQLLEEGTEDPIVEDEPANDDPLLANIEPYIELVEQFLGSNDGLDVSILESPLEDYELMMTFSTNGLKGETQTYVIHYNMTLTEEEDDESEFSLEGIMIMNDVTYFLTGEREVEADEESIEFIAKLDDDNYVESEYKVESDEIEFEIKVVLNGEIVSETKIEIEYEEDETKIELEFLSGDATGTYEFTYELEDGEPVLKIEFDVEIDGIHTKGEIVVSIIVDPVTGETSYVLFVDPEDGESYESRKDRDIDDDDEDESPEVDTEEDDIEDNEDTPDVDEEDTV